MNSKLKLFSNLLVYLSLSMLLYVIYLQSYEAALQTPTGHLDGAFQTASALARLAHGETIGKDFFFYLGIGPAYLLYPFFKLLGGNLASSVFVSYISVKLIFLLSVFVLAKLSLRLNFIQTLLFTLVFYALFQHFLFGFYMDPGISLRPLRRFVPIIGALFLLYIPHIPNNIRPLYLGVLAGILATWSNDYGYFSAFFLVIYFIYEYFIYSKSIKSLIANSFIFGFIALLTYFVLISIVTHGHTIEWITYNFKGVGENQWWYFESYTDKIFYFDEVYKIFVRDSRRVSASIILSILLIPSLFILSIAKKDISFLILSYIGLVLASGAFISEYLGHIGIYYWVGIFLWLSFAILRLISINKIHRYYHNAIAIFLLSTLVAIYFSISLIKRHNHTNDILESVNADMYNSHFDSYLNPEYLEYVRFFESELLDKNVTIVEEYASLASILLDKKSLVPFDSIIHALGKENQELYMKKLSVVNPMYITTTNPKFTHYQSWSFTQNWWFYSYLLKNYHIKKIFHNLYIWEKNKVLRSFKTNENLQCTILDNNIVITSTQKIDNSKLISVSVDYTLANNHKIIVLLENNISKMHPITSIDTMRKYNIVSFPTYLNSEELIIKSQVFPSDKEEVLNLESCQVLEVDLQDSMHFIPNKDKDAFDL